MDKGRRLRQLPLSFSKSSYNTNKPKMRADIREIKRVTNVRTTVRTTNKGILKAKNKSNDKGEQ